MAQIPNAENLEPSSRRWGIVWIVTAAVLSVLGGLALSLGALVVGAPWMRLALHGERVIGRVVEAEGRHYLRYSYRADGDWRSGVVGASTSPAKRQRPLESEDWIRGEVLTVFVDREEPARSFPARLMEPVDLFLLLGLGSLLLFYGSFGGLIALRFSQSQSPPVTLAEVAYHWFSALRLPMAILLASLLLLGLLAWFAPPEARWGVAGIGLMMLWSAMALRGWQLARWTLPGAAMHNASSAAPSLTPARAPLSWGWHSASGQPG